MASTTAKGRAAEALVLARLSTSGCEILDTNYRCPAGELDAVVREGDTICFVEVRSRGAEALVDPEETVDARKRARLRRAARYYLCVRGLEGHAARFDVVAVSEEEGMPARIEWFRDAFDMNE